MSKGSLVLRAAVGGIMLGHGLQKLNGAFDGPGLEGTEQITKSLGLHPAKHQARAVALSETLGGALTAAGFLSPLGPSMIMGTHVVAIKKVHLKNGFWSSKGGYEFNLLLMAASFALAAQGPGKLSVDGLLGKQRSGLHWALLAAALAFGAAAATLKVADAMAPVEETDGQDDALDGHGGLDLGDASTDEPVLLDEQS